MGDCKWKKEAKAFWETTLNKRDVAEHNVEAFSVRLTGNGNVVLGTELRSGFMSRNSITIPMKDFKRLCELYNEVEAADRQIADFCMKNASVTQ